MPVMPNKANLPRPWRDRILAECRGQEPFPCQAACRARFAAAGRPSLPLLELVFNPDWRDQRTSQPASSLTRWLRRWRLKKHLQSL
jgi:hypothetical protein